MYHLGSRGIEYDLMPWLEEHQTPAIAYCPLAQAGSLQRSLLKNKEVQKIAKERGITPMQVLLAFVLRKDKVIAIPRSGRMEHVLQNWAVKDVILTDEEYAAFEEFAQEDSDVRTQYHGAGLGMAIVKKYVDMMGGTISVQSKKHEGTTFTVDIPLEITDKECNKSDTGFSEKVNLTGVNVLLAEDNELNAEIAAVQLEEFGMNVERAVDGKNAVEIFRNHPEGTFDVILMDIMMPEMNGYEAAKAIRAMNDRPDGKNIPIIAMTANSFAEDVQASLDAGMNAHLSKPIVIEEVIKTILRYVHND